MKKCPNKKYYPIDHNNDIKGYNDQNKHDDIITNNYYDSTNNKYDPNNNVDNQDDSEYHNNKDNFKHRRTGVWNKDRLEGVVLYTKGLVTETEFW